MDHSRTWRVSGASELHVDSRLAAVREASQVNLPSFEMPVHVLWKAASHNVSPPMCTSTTPYHYHQNRDQAKTRSTEMYTAAKQMDEEEEYIFRFDISFSSTEFLE